MYRSLENIAQYSDISECMDEYNGLFPEYWRENASSRFIDVFYEWEQGFPLTYDCIKANAQNCSIVVCKRKDEERYVNPDVGVQFVSYKPEILIAQFDIFGSRYYGRLHSKGNRTNRRLQRAVGGFPSEISPYYKPFEGIRKCNIVDNVRAFPGLPEAYAAWLDISDLRTDFGWRGRKFNFLDDDFLVGAYVQHQDYMVFLGQDRALYVFAPDLGFQLYRVLDPGKFWDHYCVSIFDETLSFSIQEFIAEA
ncbi:hypothetical protein [Maricaulis sp. MIT060901]|uniref:hypothetical protein n=1 Tax=Maricaulis sp. MIT060901 TaxID=3096993 RepID=UPI00399BC9E1